jgi:hypothetical protein
VDKGSEIDQVRTPLEQNSEPRKHSAFHFIANFVAIAILVWVAPTILRLAEPPPRDITDYYQEWSSVRSYQLGQPLYQRIADLIVRDFGPRNAGRNWQFGYNVHPPSAILLALPFGHLGYTDSFRTWNYVGIALCVASIYLVTTALNARWAFLPAAALFVLSPHVRIQLFYGQLTFPLLFLLATATAASCRQRMVLCGALVGIAASLKLFPGLLMFPFVVRRDWRGVAGFVVGSLGMLALTAIVLGVAPFVDYVRLVMPDAIEWRSALTNSSIPALFAKAFDPGSRGTPAGYVPIASLPWLSRLLTILAASGMLLHWGWLTRRQGDANSRNVIFAIGFAAMLLLSPVCWEHYLVLMFPAMAILAIHLHQRRGGLIAWTLLVAVMFLPTFTLSARLIARLGQPITFPVMLTYPAFPFYVLLAYYALAVWCLSADETPEGNKP